MLANVLGHHNTAVSVVNCKQMYLQYLLVFVGEVLPIQVQIQQGGQHKPRQDAVGPPWLHAMASDTEVATEEGAQGQEGRFQPSHTISRGHLHKSSLV